MKQVKIATGSDVARMAGVSTPAVSQVLNNLPGTRISPGVRQKILDAAEKLGYQPHPVARALVARRTSILGVLVFELGTPFHSYSSGILNAFWSKIREHSCQMLIDGKKADEDINPVFMKKGWCDGYLVMVPPLNLKGADAIPASPHACVCVGSRPDGVSVSYVDMDNFEAGRMAVHYLAGKGHSKIAHVTGPVKVLSAARDRFEGYVQGLKDQGIPFRKEWVAQGTFLSSSGAAALEELLGRGIDFTAVFFANDGMAEHAMRYAQSRGLKIPDDISMMGINDIVLRVGEEPGPLTTINQPLDQIGAEAASILLRLLGEKPGGRRAIIKLIPGTIGEGRTVRRL